MSALESKLVFASAMTRRDGAHLQFWDLMNNADFSNMPQPLKDAARMRSFKDVPDEPALGAGFGRSLVAVCRQH